MSYSEEQIKSLAVEWAETVLKEVDKSNGKRFLDIGSFNKLKEKDNFVKIRSNIGVRVPEIFTKRILKGIDYLIAYHGTTSRVQKLIKENGLVPRSHSGLEATDSVGSHEGRLYFADASENSYARQKANNVAEALGGAPILVEAALKKNNLRPDEDFTELMGHEHCFTSALAHRTIAYQGRIQPDKITIEKIGQEQPGKDSSQYNKEQAAKAFAKLDM